MEVPSNNELFDLLSRVETIMLVHSRLAALQLSARDRYLILVRFMVDEPVSVRRLALTLQVPEDVITHRLRELKTMLQVHLADLHDVA